MHALSDYIRYYDNALPADFCKRMVDAFEQMRDAHVVNGQGVRAGLEKSRWTELNMSRYADDAMKGFFFDQIERALDHYNQELGLAEPPASPTSTSRSRQEPAASSSSHPTGCTSTPDCHPYPTTSTSFPRICCSRTILPWTRLPAGCSGHESFTPSRTLSARMQTEQIKAIAADAQAFLHRMDVAGRRALLPVCWPGR